MAQLLEGAELEPLGSSEDPLESAEGDAEDLSNLLRYLLGEDLKRMTVRSDRFTSTRFRRLADLLVTISSLPPTSLIQKPKPCFGANAAGR